MRIITPILAGFVIVGAALAQNPVTADSPLQIGYAANLSQAVCLDSESLCVSLAAPSIDSVINITNTGANGAPLNGPGVGTPSGNICVNVYAFSPDEQLVSCCSCLVTPNGLASLSAENDLTSNTLTGVRPTSIVVKLVSSLAGGKGSGGSGTSCNNSAAVITSADLATGMAAWFTTTHIFPSGVATNEAKFTPATLSAGDLASMTGRCLAIIGNGSGFGVCRSCRAGGLGAAKK